MVLLVTALSSANAQWQWSNALQTYTYVDNDGRIHYADGSVGPASTLIGVDSQGRAVYSANSAGPADKTGTYAVQAARIDESTIGPAPTSPPADAVTVSPGSTTGAVFGGTDSSRTTYISCSDASMGSTNYQLCNVGTNTNNSTQVTTTSTSQTGNTAIGQVANAVVVGSTTTSTASNVASLVSQVKAADVSTGTVSVVNTSTSSGKTAVFGPATVTSNSSSSTSGTAVFGPSGSGNGLSGPSYRDEYGRVHYADGSVGPATPAWFDNGVWVYATKQLPE